MAVRLRYKIEITCSSTTAEEKDLGNLKSEVVTDVCNEGGTWKTTLAGGATDIQIPLDSIAAAKFLFIRATSKDPNLAPVQVTIKRNSNSAEAINIVPFSDVKEGHLLLSTSGLTAIYATNSSGTVVMDLTIVAIGD
jgi:hypothetical protein